MPRSRRICIPGIPLHVIQRGNNRQDCFLHRRDYQRYLEYLAKAAEKHEVLVHAYVLMTNHVHLLITPNNLCSASRMMQQLGGRYAQTFNRIHGRTGPLWDGRFRSFPIVTEKYLFATYRYIELNPVRAGMVRSPESYRWSSHRTNALGARDALIQARDEWTNLGPTKYKRCAGYRKLFATALDQSVLAEIRASIKSGSDPGSDPS